MIKRLLLLIILSIFSFSSFVEGKIIDIQKDTVCNFNYCQSSIDLSTHLNTNAINVVKSLDLKEYLPKIAGIESISYEWNGNILTIKGKINQSTYWAMGLPNTDLTIDPWWNNSYSCKYRLNITTTTGIASGQSINVTINTTDTSCFKLASGNDTRIVVDTGGTYEEKYTFNTSEFGYAKTEIWFNLSSSINAGSFNDSYYIYSGNDGLTTNPYSDGRKVFKYFFDKSNSWYTVQATCTQTEATTYRNLTIIYTTDDSICGFYPNITETSGTIWQSIYWRDYTTRVDQLYMDYDNSTTNNQLLWRVNFSGNGSLDRYTNSVYVDTGWSYPINQTHTIAINYQQDSADKQRYMFRYQNKTEYIKENETIAVTSGVGINRIRWGSYVSGTKASSGTEIDFFYLFWTPWLDAKVSSGTLEIQDSTPPQYTDIKTNITNVSCNSPFNYSFINISWTDNNGLSVILLEHNATGTKTNYTMGTTFGGSIYNYTFNITTNTSKLIFWRSYANDTSGNVNDTTENRVDYNFSIYYENCTTTTPINTSSSIVNCCPELQSFCISNTTLLKNATVNGEAYNETVLCAWGCDTTLNACKLAPTYQWLIIGGLGILVIWVIRFLRFR